MSEELDINKVAVEFVNQHIESFYSAGKGILKGAAHAVRLRLDKSYKAYLLCVTERYSKGKSFFIRHEPTSLYTFYVPMDISCGETRIKGASFAELVSQSPYTVITGSGGGGKSMLMRHLFLDAVIHKGKVPVFLELRRLNNSDQTLLEFIKETLQSNHFNLGDDYIDKAIKAGHFAFLLDGFDEIAISQRKAVSKQILQLASKYEQNNIIVSSRPDSEFSGWQSFTVFQVNPLTLNQACDLVEKLPFDHEVKSKFSKDLRSGLFEKHHSFLSNPLLLSIMLLTYGENADIPSKLNVFYNQAYEALFQRHDALKGAFQRDRFSNLDIQDFGKVFSVFSLQTYDKRTFEMSKSEALHFLEKSKQMVDIKFDENDYLQDAQQAVCLLLEDGLMITFAHRSFQEYFVANFIANSKPEIQQKLIKKYAEHMLTDSVFSLLYEMNPELMETKFILPGLEEIEKALGIKKKVGISHYMRYLRAIISEFHLLDTVVYPSFSAKGRNWVHIIWFALRNCRHLIGLENMPLFGVVRNPDLSKSFNGKDSISISKINSRDEIVKEFAVNVGLLSKTALEQSFAIKRALIEKHERLEHSLDEILNVHG